MSPPPPHTHTHTMGGGGHIVFSADPVGISIGVATCLHSVSLLNGQILAKLISLEWGKMLIRFW